MITVEINGNAQVEHEYVEDGKRGQDPYALSSTVQRFVGFEAFQEFPEGHVNLEGFVLSENWTTEEDLLSQFVVYDHPILEDTVINDDTVDVAVAIEGEPGDWLQQAARYVTERPQLSIRQTLAKFHSWDETNTEAIHKATEMVGQHSEKVQGFDGVLMNKAVGGFSDREYNKMLDQLESLAPNKEFDRFRVDDGAD